ncbi:cytochrome c1 heme lyase CYT2 ASCRUDRAFT_7367 [Ascoidea rubescens DSM 1968]|uniref:Holocytochrome c-type synthase n=1 Tax=Ascoidea rubescens DSM 1968 TaxID=1344418 RepID=A0A1D2VJW7_9ASCO|nr:hypothetical protein ASCRUDRAFT_7367 [Ascoidea rubescens DSM 1968]ODV61902.1 hypothetical protein ASCRUDRAFT_7367 [Ascoidea rubescens DSM 1968]
MTEEDNQPKCPVDHSTREAWLRNNPGSTFTPPTSNNTTTATANAATVDRNNSDDRKSNSSWLGFGWLYSSNVEDKKSPAKVAENQQCSSDSLVEELMSEISINNNKLAVDRQISSIPRTGANSNWIYPSQKQFYEAMKRKNWDPDSSDMKSIVPIHNLVNEQAWYLIRLWEKDQGGESCGGIELTSFKGNSKKLTPRARWKLIMGYQKPFDRHDWTINRCGKQVDYVIDFYSGKTIPGSDLPSFYLDVRPKLNSFEGFRLRLFKSLGL